MFNFAARFAPAEEDGYTVTFRDIPEAITQGDTLDEARAMAADALLTAMDFYFEDRRPVPAPSPRRKGEEVVGLPASVAAKVLLLNEMVRQQVKASELARRLDTSPQVVNRLIDLRHATKIDAIDAALRALGRELEVSIAA
jgi:antitoxin HicB